MIEMTEMISVSSELAVSADLFSSFDWSKVSNSDAYLESGRMNLAKERGKDQHVGLGMHIPISTTLPQFTKLNLSKNDVVSSSYRLLPKRNKLGKSVLNDDCILVKRDSEHLRFRTVNKYEVLFNCKHDRYCVDMYLETEEHG